MHGSVGAPDPVDETAQGWRNAEFINGAHIVNVDASTCDALPLRRVNGTDTHHADIFRLDRFCGRWNKTVKTRIANHVGYGRAVQVSRIRIFQSLKIRMGV